MKQILTWLLLTGCLLSAALHAQEVESEKDSVAIKKGTIYKAAIFTGIYYATSLSILNNT